MKLNSLKISLGLLLVGLNSFCASAVGVTGVSISFNQWIETCQKLPKNRETSIQTEKSALVDLAGSKERAQIAILETIQQFSNIMLQSHDKSQWINGKVPNLSSKKSCGIYAQKLILNSDDVVYVQGDLHGDIYSLTSFLKELQVHGVLKPNSFEIAKANSFFGLTKPKKTYLLFLGDYTDRGFYGLEVMYTLWRLKIANPEQVVLVRGNHEDCKIASQFGFWREVQCKLDRSLSGPVLDVITKMYELLPAVLYVGNHDFIQCCHGGLEVGYCPTQLLNAANQKYELINRLNRAVFFNRHSGAKDHMPIGVNPEELQDIELTCPCMEHRLSSRVTTLGFMWGDFQVGIHSPSSYANGRGICASKALTDVCLPAIDPRIKSIFRAHQHSGELNSMMQGLVSSKGVFKLWHSYETDLKRTITNGSVFTFNVSPDSQYGVNCNYGFMTYGKLVAKSGSVESWDLFVYNIDLFGGQHRLISIEPEPIAAPIKLGNSSKYDQFHILVEVG